MRYPGCRFKTSPNSVPILSDFFKLPYIVQLYMSVLSYDTSIKLCTWAKSTEKRTQTYATLLVAEI
jgi:hypothetical protein